MTTQRNNSLDLLRIIAMLMVILLHLNGYGGIVDLVDSNRLSGGGTQFT